VVGVWGDRLAEVWAAPGKAGAGLVVGAETVLTARHVLAGALKGGDVMARVVRPGAATAGWVQMVVLAEDQAWDVALLRPHHGSGGDDAPEWLKPSSPSPAFVRLGTSAEAGCEAAGFPQSEVMHAAVDNLAGVIRQTEQAYGTLAPAGQAKTPPNLGRQLPKRWIPLNVDGPTPGTHTDWGGMSGAGVLLPDGRVAGIVVGAEGSHQLRRLYVVPMADVLDHSSRIADALTSALGASVIAEARYALLYRNVLREQCLGPDGLPTRVGEAPLKAFGVKPAGIPGESEFLDYVPRNGDQKLQDSLLSAQAEGRILLIVGGSAGGKSRSAAEAARLLYRDYRLLCPRQTSLARLPELPVTDLGPSVVWLDDVERYDERTFRDTVDWLRHSGVVVVATIRRTELQARMPRADYRYALAEVLADKELVLEVAWPVIWTDRERARVSQHVSYPPLLAAVGDGTPPSVWVVAGPALENRMRDAQVDDERPTRYALLRSVLDWYRTGIAQPIPKIAATGLLHSYLSGRPEPADIEDALRWARESVLGTTRTTSQSLLTEIPDQDALTVNDYIQDADARADRNSVPDAVWEEALRLAATDDARFAIGQAADFQGNSSIASKAFLPLASKSPEPPVRRRPEPRSRPSVQPYRGLLPFSETDSEVFYGRERLTVELAARLAVQPTRAGPIIVTGASGAGKSSLLRAGLLPALARGIQIVGSGQWPRIVITPSRQPMVELATQLAALSGTDVTPILEELTKNPNGAHLTVQRAITASTPSHDGADKPRLVLIVDQFEQVFTLSPGKDGDFERQAFITALCATATNSAEPGNVPSALVVIVVRGDYFDRCAAYPELARALQENLFVVGPMTESDLRLAITGPAEAAGLSIDPALTGTILSDLLAADDGESAGVLPLLSQAMLTTWEHREGDRLTVHGYGKSGGVAHAVQTSADNVYDALSSAQQALARDLFRSMTVFGRDGRLTRRPVARAELYAAHVADRAQIDAVLEAFASRRLIVLNDDHTQIAHEVLLAAWPRLRGWLEDDQATWVQYGQLVEDASNWRDNANDPSYLYRGSQLAAARHASTQWAANPSRYPPLTATLRDFLQAGERAASRRSRTRRLVTVSLVILLCVSLVSAGFTAFSARNANRLRADAVSGELVTESQALIAADTGTAALLAAAAWQVSPTPSVSGSGETPGATVTGGT
jgi:hypothetical protein